MDVMKAGELVSVAIAPIGLFLSLFLIFFYGRGLLHSFKRYGFHWASTTTPVVAAGVAASIAMFVHITGSNLDSSYWQWAWTSKFKGWPISATLFEWGWLPNVPFRNITLVIASYLGLYSYYRWGNDHSYAAKRTNKLLKISIGLTVVFLTVLYLLPNR